MSWSFSRVLVAGFLEANSLDTQPSVPLSTTLTPDQFYWPDKTTEHSRLSRFGMTCEPLMGNRGAELLTWFLAGSLAKTSALPDVVTDWTESVADSGGKWRESLAKYDPDSHGLKTAQLSLIEDWTGCSVTLPRSGLMLSGQCWELPMLGRITRETDFGYLPTPTATDAKGSVSLERVIKRALQSSRGVRLPEYLAKKHQVNVGSNLNPSYVEQLMGWQIGHSDLKPLETVKFLNAKPQHGDCSEANK